MKKESKEIADVAMEIVGEVAENAHAEMEREKTKLKFVKRVQGTITRTENYPDFKKMVEALGECDKAPLRGDFEYHPVLGYVLTTSSRFIDK